MDLKRIGVTVAAVVAGTIVLCLIGGLLRRRWAGGAWAVLVALAVAPLAADKPLLDDWPQWRAADVNHGDAVQRIILAGVPIAAAALAVSAKRLPAWPRGLLAAAAPAAVVTWIIAAFPSPPADWHGQRTFAAIAAAVVWLLVEPLAARRPTGVAAPWVCGVLAAGAGLLNLFSADTGPAWVAVAVGGVIGGAFLFALTGRGPSFARGPVAVVAAVLACVVVSNHIGTGGVPTGRWLLLAAAPAVAWVVELRPMRTWRPWLREPLRMALVAAPVVAAVVPAYRQFQREQAAETGGAGWSMVMPAAVGQSRTGYGLPTESGAVRMTSTWVPRRAIRSVGC